MADEKKDTEEISDELNFKNKDDVLNKYWGLTVILDQIRAGTEQWRQRIVG